MNITLLDGREMTVYPKKDQPEKIEPLKIGFDMTGQFMRFPDHIYNIPDKSILERGLAYFRKRIFGENARMFYENADKIFSDSRMFFAPVNTGSCLAYFGDNMFRDVPLGVYLEWWLYFSEASIDKNGNLIWYMAGSPLTGANQCFSITPEGNSVKMAKETHFSEAWRTFIGLHKVYSEDKQKYEHYSLEEVVLKMRGKDYENEMEAVKQECIDWTVLNNNRPDWPPDGTDLKKKVKAARRTRMQILWREIMDFYNVFSKKEEQLKKVEESGNIGAYRKSLHELAQISSEFISETFGRNPNRICLTDILNYAKYRESLGLED